MLVLYVFDDKLGRAECLLTHFTHVLLFGNDFSCLVRTVLVLHLNKQFVLLGVAKLLIRALLEDLLCCLDIILFKLACGTVKCRGVKDYAFDGRWQAEVLTAALSS